MYREIYWGAFRNNVCISQHRLAAVTNMLQLSIANTTKVFLLLRQNLTWIFLVECSSHKVLPQAVNQKSKILPSCSSALLRFGPQITAHTAFSSHSIDQNRSPGHMDTQLPGKGEAGNCSLALCQEEDEPNLVNTKNCPCHNSHSGHHISI